MARWYDDDKSFAEDIDKLRDSVPNIRDAWVKDLLEIINKSDPGQMNTDKLLDFPLTMFRRRWYDNDPYLWIMMNSLQNSNDKTVLAVKEYLAGK